MNASTNQPDKDEPLADLLVGARRIAEYITSLGVPVDESGVFTTSTEARSGRSASTDAT